MRLAIPLAAAVAAIASMGASGGTVPSAAPAPNAEEVECMASGEDEATKSPESIDCVVVPAEKARAAKEYWTEERMRSAKPLPTPSLDPKTKKQLAPE